ncbi:protein-disulfide reductase DsbD [Orrella daihaiensis]|uniref:Thiol:disulfide interchange protein DsbD n=1 Tax=Orrella daihaiensis TaxID=2782176 RepID=A0ABY4AJL2_9BURK|nr:protein-disulfide reductase DsbD [Orrella daihaiensis]UOD50477.1 protein-disulfide reductase DsbD [Orrella daihaiensis]
MITRRFYFLLLVFLSLCIGVTKVAYAQDFLAPEKAFAMQARMLDGNTMAVRYDIAPKYYMYQERFEFDLRDAPFNLPDITLPPGEIKYDPTFEKDMALYFGSVEFGVALPNWPGDVSPAVLTLILVSQGCAEAGLCYPPMESAVQLLWNGGSYQIVHQQPIVDVDRPLLAASAAVGATAAGTGVQNSGSWQGLLSGGDDRGIASALDSSAVWQIVLLFFALGALLAFTPCVLPMIPILSVLIVGQGNQVSRLRGLSLAAAYVLGMSVIYTLLGVLAGISGAGLAAWLQTPWVLSIFALLLVLFGLAMFDVIRVEMPQSVQTKLSSAASGFKGGRLWAALIMGAVSALIVGPCVAAPLAGALLYISQSGDWVLGGTALFAMAWGMGLPLLIVGASAGSLLPKAGPWMDGVKAFFGVLLFATAWWMLGPVLPSWIQILGWSLLAVLSAVLLGAFESLPKGLSLGSAIRKTLGLLLALVAVIWLVGLASGGRSLLQPLQHLAGSGSPTQVASPTGKPVFELVASVAELDQRLAQSTRPVMLDFYADWCVSCKEMELFTFSDSAVAQRMGQMLLLKADVTANNANDRALLKRFNLFGPPGIIFFEPGGREVSDIRVVGFQNAERFAGVLDQVLAR